MKTEIVSNSYENGQRVSMQKVIYDKSDDLFKLANLQRQYEVICARIADCTSETELLNYEIEKTRLEAEIKTQTEFVEGYEETSTE